VGTLWILVRFGGGVGVKWRFLGVRNACPDRLASSSFKISVRGKVRVRVRFKPQVMITPFRMDLCLRGDVYRNSLAS
jgi:hypothetical protein